MNHDSARCPVCSSRLSDETLVLAYEDACSILARQQGSTHPTTLRTMMTLAEKYTAVGLQTRAASVLVSVRRTICKGDATTSQLCRLGRARLFQARGETDLALKTVGVLVYDYQEVHPIETAAKKCEVEALRVRGECFLSLNKREDARICFSKGLLLVLDLPNACSNLDLLASMLESVSRSFLEDGKVERATHVLGVLTGVLAKAERDTCALAIAKLNWATLECSHRMIAEDTLERLRCSVGILRARNGRDPRAALHLPRGVAALAAIVQPKRRLRKKTRIEAVPTT